MIYPEVSGTTFTYRLYQKCSGIALGSTGRCGSCGATTDSGGSCSAMIEIAPIKDFVRC